MAFIDIDRTYVSERTPTQADIDNIIDGIETFLNVTGISDDNLQNDSIDADAKFVDASITQSKMGAGAVETSHIQALAVTTDKFDDGAVGTSDIAALNVTNAELAENAVGTTNIVNGAVDPVHITPNQADSSSYANMAEGDGSYTTVNTVTITTTGGPVFLFIAPKQSNSENSYMYHNAAAYSGYGSHATRGKLLRNGSSLGTFFVRAVVDSHGKSKVLGIPPNIGTYFEVPSAGTHTYTLQFLSYNGLGTVYNVELVAWEL